MQAAFWWCVTKNGCVFNCSYTRTCSDIQLLSYYFSETTTWLCIYAIIFTQQGWGKSLLCRNILLNWARENYHLVNKVVTSEKNFVQFFFFLIRVVSFGYQTSMTSHFYYFPIKCKFLLNNSYRKSKQSKFWNRSTE